MNKLDGPLSVIIPGASGDLARKKVVPAFFSLFCQNLLPANFLIIGFARTGMSDDSFRQLLRQHLTCRYSPPSSCVALMEEFLIRCHYVQGAYNSRDSFLDLYARLRDLEATAEACRIFYLAVPPSVYGDIAEAMAGSGLVSCGLKFPWTRVVVEKPFGEDRQSSDRLARLLAKIFEEEQIYRIDHYLGKEAVQNLLVLRFANTVFEPLWSNRLIKALHIDWSERTGVEGRASYFDEYGIIRDVMQNHLLQILALAAMEEPNLITSAGIRDAKTAVLRSLRPARVGDMALGQYRGYTEEDGVASGSKTPTFAAAFLAIENERWRGVPVLMTAGKALAENKNEIRVLFKSVAGNKFCAAGKCPQPNKMIVRIQPDEAIYLDIVTKRPGLDVALESKPLDLRYSEAFKGVIPDAYERLLLDVINGDKSLFIGLDELAAAWDVFSPALREISETGIQPEIYDKGTVYPNLARQLARRFDIVL